MNGSGETFEVYDPDDDTFLFGYSGYFEDNYDFRHMEYAFEDGTRQLGTQDSVTLSEPTVGGPAEPVDGATVQFESATSVLSLDSVAGAQSYTVNLDNGTALGSIGGIPADGSITLDEDFVTATLAPGSPWGLSFFAQNASAEFGAAELSQMRGSQDTIMMPPGTELHQVWDTGSTASVDFD
mgnify:FL=1